MSDEMDPNECIEFKDIRDVDPKFFQRFKYRGTIYCKQRWPGLIEAMKEHLELNVKEVFSTHRVTHGNANEGQSTVFEFGYCKTAIFLESGRVLLLDISERMNIFSRAPRNLR